MLEFIFSKDVAKARQENTPILALESTIITHGMPFPQNVQMVEKVEKIAKDEGVTPATIAVIDGKVHIGLEAETLDDLAKRQGVAKLSRADVAHCIATGATGATTVAATMILAKAAKIDVFATGGIGGVHKGAETSFDISADLGELARTEVVVVAAGAKAILDLPKTFEVLETQGVPVIGFGVDELPAFYSRTSGISAPLRADEPAEIAKSFLMRQSLKLEGGMLVANPIPVEAEIPEDEILPIIHSALKKAESKNIKAKAVTPFLLDEIYHQTNGRSLVANIALVENNVRLGAQIALAIHQAKHT